MRSNADQHPVAERVWAVVATPTAIGIVLLVSGAALVAGSVAASGGGWLEPLRLYPLVPIVASLLAAASLLWLGGIWERFVSTVSAPTSEGEPGWALRSAPILGGVLVLVGAAISVASWFSVHAASRPGDMTLSAGEKAESFQSRIAGEQVDVMLPLRFHFEQRASGDGPLFEVALSEAGGDRFGRRQLRPGESIAVRDYRITPVDHASEKGRLQATIESSEEKTIPARVAPGDSFKVRPEGPSYEVREIVENYLGFMGPAARLESEEHGEFWVFQRAAKEEGGPAFAHDLVLASIERAPAVVFFVSPNVVIWPVALGGCLLVLGLALCMALPERVRYRDQEGVFSFNAAGRLSEEEQAGEVSS